MVMIPVLAACMCMYIDDYYHDKWDLKPEAGQYQKKILGQCTGNNNMLYFSSQCIKIRRKGVVFD